ncbi:HypC/HybG/HupF family hydrogenase formation chaperone [Candidatus Woesearchaeota archaeon]|nr:HypC/HybG/HupF family hydrogenase formation chaperone [Candidatus Woesearchaeota archaeon]
MCMAVPGKIIRINKDMAIVDYGKEKREAKLVEKKFNVGDYVIVQNKIVIEKVPEQEVREWLSLFEK